VRLNQVTVPMTDYAASVAFYRALGLVLIVDAPPHYARFECPQSDGGEPATFSLEKVDGWRGCDWPQAFFEVDDLDGAVARLAAMGFNPSCPVDQDWLWREAELRDPAGNRVKLYHAGRNRRFPPWRLKDV
jgi:hydroxymethylpyrimidine/phosphomethylpyrimidine kinase